ncbi:glycoside hydrolase family 10 protein [Paenibacillus gansuensis]|uniref:Glycoside hydrolase family 10 protein n=1 Tax=Paenibacillus gansuensis TaxID=306542 RepID=A0ABW5P817_9BACL
MMYEKTLFGPAFRKAALAGTLAVAMAAVAPFPGAPQAAVYAQSADSGYSVTASDGFTAVISGLNMTRGAGMLVAYTPLWGYSTSTNAFGAEVVLVETGTPGQYEVKDVNSAFGDVSRSGNSEIPVNGLVLSAGPGGTPDVRKDLLTHFKVGDRVTYSEPITKSASNTVMVIDPTPQNNPAGALFDGYRGPDQLLVYTPAFGPSTRTNQYGYEVTVVDGIIQSAGGADSAIPANGYVISAHGTNAAWLSSISEVGAKVQLNGLALTISKDASSYVYQAGQAVSEAKAAIQKGYDQFVNAPFEQASAQVQKAETLLKQARLVLESDPVASVYVSKQATAAARDAFYLSLPSRTAESRGVWYRPLEKSPEQIAKTLDRMQAAGFNELYLETWWQGYTIFPSKTAAEHGIAEQNPLFKGWDPLKVFMEEAAKRGIAVHAWLDGFMVGIDPSGGPVLKAHPDWSAVSRSQVGSGKPMPQKGNGYFWMDITNPAVQNYLLGITKEMVTSYHMAGVDLDYMRFPHASDWKESYNFSDYSRTAYAKESGIDPYTLDPQTQPEQWKQWSDWIVDAEDEFVKTVYREMKALNSQLVVSATPEPGAEAEKIGNWSQYVDVVIPQAYSYSVDSVRESVQQHMSELKPGNLTYSGIFPMYVHMGPYETVAQVQAARDIDHGTTIFAFGQASPLAVDALRKGPWRDKAVSTGMHPQQAIAALLESMVKDANEVYVPRKAMDEKTAKLLEQKVQVVTKQLNEDLPWKAYGSVEAMLGQIEALINLDTTGINPVVVQKLGDQISYARMLLTYSVTKQIK